MKKIKVGLCQMPVVDDKKINLRTAGEYVAKCAEQGADIVILPEMFCCPYSNDKFPEYAEPVEGYIWSSLADIAEKNHIYLVGGSMPEAWGDNNISNTSFVFDRAGNQLARHRKVHLFDINVPGGQYFMESDVFTAGNQVTTFKTEFGDFGLMICFDIRFAELSRLMASDGAKAIFVPAAFNMTTGPAHWELNFRGRALDNQLFMIGCAPARDYNSPYVSYGNSIITAPWGDIQCRMEDTEGVLVEEIDLDMTRQVRDRLPIIKGLRTDMYSTKLI